ncbi:MAG: hypothetical protein Q9201_001697 [Fulgogasparrea decipioides]
MENSAEASSVTKLDITASERKPSFQEDVLMGESSEDEQEEDDIVASTEQEAKPARPTRSEKEKELREMMDRDGNTNSLLSSGYKSLRGNPDDESMETNETDARQQVQQQPVSGSKAKEEEEKPETPAAVSGGQRRGRRKVMKKKMLKDEEGYLGSSHSYPPMK